MAIDTGGKQKNGEPDYEELLDELELKIDRLKVLYEQYFMGIEKLEPQTARKEVSRKLLEITQQHIRNTGLRYRFNMLNQKFSVYVTYWNRTLRAIENGTYIRDVARATRDALRRGVEIPQEVLRAMPEKMRERVLKERAKVVARAEKQAAAKTAKAPAAVGAPAAAAADVDFDEAFDSAFDNLTGSKDRPAEAAKPAAPPPKPAAPPPRPGPQLPPGMDEKAAQELYRRYVQAKKLLGENTDNLRYETLVATLAKQAPAIIKQHQAKGVDFSVVIKDDKVILKATPRK